MSFVHNVCATVPVFWNGVDWRLLVKDRFPNITKLRETICENLIFVDIERRFRINLRHLKYRLEYLCFHHCALYNPITHKAELITGCAKDREQLSFTFCTKYTMWKFAKTVLNNKMDGFSLSFCWSLWTSFRF